MFRRHGFTRPAQIALSIMIASLAASRPAEAHVKWFCTYDVASPPRALGSVASADFGNLVLITLAALLTAGLVERTFLGKAMLASIDRVTWVIRGRAEAMIRLTLAGFFLCLAYLGGIILTPELHTTATWVPVLQLGIAAGMVSRRTLPFSAAGIAVLYVYAVDQYCLFHLLDYPVFLGLAAFLALTGLKISPFGIRPIDLLRYAAGITLMWASVEKWAYPQWTYPLLTRHPEMTFGFGQDFYMHAAGVVEFALAFTLICGPLMRRVSAIVLTAMFVSAIFEFGRIDAIGHSPIIVVLLAVVADRGVPGRVERPLPWLAPPLRFCGSLAATVALYYGIHAGFYHAAMS